jgi:hypothetical protein
MHMALASSRLFWLRRDGIFVFKVRWLASN